MRNRFVVVDEHTIHANNIAAYLEHHGWDVRSCGSAEEALSVCESFQPCAVAADMRLPQMSGIELLSQLRQSDTRVQCILMTSDDRMQAVPLAGKAGLCEFVSKPFAMEELRLRVERGLASARREQVLDFHRRQQARISLATMIGQSAPIQRVRQAVSRLLESGHVSAGSLLLIRGEHGTGKNLLARAVHSAGCRSGNAFVEVHCGGIAPKALEAELFGCEASRCVDFVSAAEGGTLFLNDVSVLAAELQAKLLKLVKEGTFCRLGSAKQRRVDVHVICATSGDLEALVRQGRFNRALYASLRVHTVPLPPLRERGDDVVLLADHFLSIYGREQGRHNLRLSDGALNALRQYAWPGNVRELISAVDRAVLLARGGLITAAHFELQPARGGAPGLESHSTDDACRVLLRDELSIAGAVRLLTLEALHRTGWNVSESATLLGLSPEMIVMRLLKLSQP